MEGEDAEFGIAVGRRYTTEHLWLQLIDEDKEKDECTVKVGVSDFVRVEYGETVRQGQRIGDVGSSGLSTGPHLHFEMRINHVLRNPKKYLPY